MSKEFIEELRSHAAARTGYTTELIGKAADAIESQAATIARYEVTAGNCDLLRAQVEEQAREIERLRMRLVACGVVALANTPESAAKARDMHPDYMSASCGDVIRTVDIQMQLRAELAALKAQPSVVDERAAFEAWYLGHFYMGDKHCGLEWLSTEQCGGYRHEHPAEQWIVWQARAALSANHSEQVLEGWQLVPVEPIDAMLEAGDKYIGTPATYKAMLSACPSPAITKDFSQFLSAVMDAAGLIRHGRQSKELSEYLGMKCMEYRGAALSAPSHGEQVRGWIPVGERLPDRGQGTVAVLTEEGDTLTAWASYWSGASDAFASWSFPHLDDEDSVVTHWMPLPAAPSAGSQEQGE